MTTKSYKCISMLILLMVTLIVGYYVVIPVRASGTIYYVKQNATGTKDGTSWKNAFTNLQSALSVASSGDEIWVAAGTYKPTTGTDRNISFTLQNGVAIYGGFTGTETLLSQRNPVTKVTILSGDIGIVGDSSDNSFHVVIGTNIDNTAILDGFTIKLGTAQPWYNGGGIINTNSSPTLNNLIFTQNSASQGGGMFNITGSNPNLTNVTFNSNTSFGGGGMANISSNPNLLNVIFTNNSATGSTPYGGGLSNQGSSPILTNVTFSSNSAYYGGGISNYPNSSPILNNVTFSSNSATVGGGMYNFNNSSPSLTNVTFKGNTVSSGGGGLANNNSSPILTNTTFSGNSAPGNFGGGISNVNSSPIIRNSILYDYGTEIWNSGSSAPTLTYSIVQGGYIGTGNLNVNPLLGALANNGGFTQTMAIGAGSPALDTGNDTYCPSTDQRGKPRLQGSHCDIGAYEYQYPPTPTFTPTITATSTSTYTPTITNTPFRPVSSTPIHPTPRPIIKSQALASALLTIQSGITDGSLPSLSLLDQSNTDDDPAVYVSFQTPDGVYLGYQSFFLPQDTQPKFISTMLLQLNVKAPATSSQVWTWSIYDWSSNMWIKIGDSLGTEADQWQSLVFRIRQPWRYVSPGHEIRIQLQSNNADGDIKIDYEALHLTYLSIPVTPTPVAPVNTSNRPGIFSVPNIIPTATPRP